MAEIKPFRPLKYTNKCGQLADAVSPPYDIIGPEERKKLIERSEYNVVQLELPEGGDDRYKNAAKLLEEWKQRGVLAADDKAGIYVYSETFLVKGRTYTVFGMLCRVKLCDFSEKVVLPHEETLSKAKTDRFNLMSETFCNFSPVYSLYLDDKGDVPTILSDAMKNVPEAEFIDEDGVTHRLWKIDDEEKIEKIQSLMSEKQLFIADGHHRYETALNFRNSLLEEGKLDETSADSIMMMLVDMDNPGLVVFPTHRLVNPPEDISVKEMLEKCSEDFDIVYYSDITKVESVLSENTDGTSVALYDGSGGFYLLKYKNDASMKKALPSKSDAYRGLDVAVLHTLILDDILGIDAENMAQGKSLTYTRDIDYAVQSVKDGKAKFAFIMNPTKIREIKDVSLAGEKMPQKSTYFYPKLTTGLAINDLRIKD